MATKIVKRRDLTFLDRIYVSGVLLGIWITSKHFVQNLFFHIMHVLGFFKEKPAMVTFEYPEEQRPLSYRTRTRHRLAQRADGSPRCVACMMCETICPARCINIMAAEHPDPNIEKMPSSFDLDLGRCVFCGFCVEVCPEDAIRMDTRIMDIAAYSRRDMMLDMEELLKPRSKIPRSKFFQKIS